MVDFLSQLSKKLSRTRVEPETSGLNNQRNEANRSTWTDLQPTQFTQTTFMELLTDMSCSQLNRK